MKTNEPGNHEEALRKVLKEWRTDAALPTRFQEAVWRRIERTERVQTPTARSSWAFIARVKGELGERYVRVLDPYQTPRQ